MAKKDINTNSDEKEYEELTIYVRPDLYRAFRRCVWMTIYETGMSQIDIHNEMIEELLKNRQC
jgi:hypothetical protein